MTKAQQRDASLDAGELVASRLFAALHERFEELRERDGLTQADIADRIGAAEQMISRWLSEPRNITIKSAGRLFFALRSHLHFDVVPFPEAQTVGANCPFSVRETVTNTVTASGVQIEMSDWHRHASATGDLRDAARTTTKVLARLEGVG